MTGYSFVIAIIMGKKESGGVTRGTMHRKKGAFDDVLFLIMYHSKMYYSSVAFDLSVTLLARFINNKMTLKQ